MILTSSFMQFLTPSGRLAGARYILFSSSSFLHSLAPAGQVTEVDCAFLSRFSSHISSSLQGDWLEQVAPLTSSSNSSHFLTPAGRLAGAGRASHSGAHGPLHRGGGSVQHHGHHQGQAAGVAGEGGRKLGGVALGCVVSPRAGAAGSAFAYQMQAAGAAGEGGRKLQPAPQATQLERRLLLLRKLLTPTPSR